MSEEEKEFNYPRVKFTRKRVIENEIEIVHVNLYSIVTDSHLGEELEVDFDGYYPYQGEVSVDTEMTFSQRFHWVCYVTYMTGMIPEDIEYDDESAKDWLKDFDIRDNGRFE